MRTVVVALLVCATCATTSGCSSSRSPQASGSDAGPDVEGDSGTDAVEAGTDASCPAPDGATTTLSPASNPPLVVAGDTGSVNGISDPSLSWPSGSAAGYLSYSTLQSTSLFTRIAKTTDGKSFTYLNDANAYVDLSVTTSDTGVCGSSTCTGRLVHETSSLIDDPLDPDPTRRFKLFDYSYVIVPAATPPAQHAWGYIGLYTAPAPEKGWSAGSKAIGWTSTAPTVSSDGAATVLSTVPALQDCGAFTEPAALVDSTSGDLYLALGCALQSSARVVLLRSVDHASTFTYVGLLLDVADGTTLGSTLPGLMPTDFFQVGGVTYLIVSTFGSTPVVPDAPTGYTSCTTVRVDDLGSASVKRDGQGNAVAFRKLVAPGGAFAGACAFKPQFATGYLVDEVTADAGTPNQVFASGIGCP
jgi:hypothetical protein